MEERDFSEIAEEKKELLDQSFRDAIATINKQGKRNYIFPKKPKGKLYNLRTLASVIYLVVFFTLPFIKVDEEPLFLFNVVQRKFIFFWANFLAARLLHFCDWPYYIHSFHYFFHSSFRQSFFADGPVRKPFLWKWCLGKLSIGWMAMLKSNVG